jgi:hypothetical protein
MNRLLDRAKAEKAGMTTDDETDCSDGNHVEAGVHQSVTNGGNRAEGDLLSELTNPCSTEGSIFAGMNRLFVPQGAGTVATTDHR